MKQLIGLLMYFVGLIGLYASTTIVLMKTRGEAEGFWLATLLLFLTHMGCYLFWKKT